MSLLTAMKAKNPDLGYCPDFVLAAMSPWIKDIKSKGIRVISNAGGVNPWSCAKALKAIALKSGIQLKVSVVAGDDLLSMVLSEPGLYSYYFNLNAFCLQVPEEEAVLISTTDGLVGRENIRDMNDNKPLPASINSMNAYLGAGPIKQALDRGADVVITGRCVDSAVVLAPLMHSFNWKNDNYDLLAAGSLAGHLIECGAQSTGGIFTDWHAVNGWENIGFPIVECAANGSFVITKPPKTGGMVSWATVAEQLVYEIGDPKQYLLPDVTCDFSNATLEELKDVDDAVLVKGALGFAPSDQYKVCATYADGYRATAVACIAGIKSVEKGRKTADAILKRVRGIYKQLGIEDFRRVNVQIVGAEDGYKQPSHVNELKEAIIWIATHHNQKKALELFSREIAAAGTGMAPGLTAFVGGRPKVSPVLHLYSFLYPKNNVNISVDVDGNTNEYVATVEESKNVSQNQPKEIASSGGVLTGKKSYRLLDLAYARSGDKGNNANIGVIARNPAFIPYIRKYITEEVVKNVFAQLFDNIDEKSVTRYEIPGIMAFNFVLKDVLGGGGVASLRTDPQGKAFAQILLDMKIDNMPDLDEYLKT